MAEQTLEEIRRNKQIISKMEGELELFLDSEETSLFGKRFSFPVTLYLWDGREIEGDYTGFKRYPNDGIKDSSLLISGAQDKSGKEIDLKKRTCLGSGRGLGFRVREIERVKVKETGKVYRFPNYDAFPVPDYW